ncbi:hypothetical protein [Arthrobacter sp. Soil763]|uniref:hypothetical protein n=1 Tax=Arthrobacter sp. Soil763 TaxID=1736402 RepID=UPI0006FD868B|nr:hypothetical protein [Arthrobacter sp. Soil763]KRE80046.1 ATP/GTP-binding protein [Arthrobacter sp. Soil763]
MPRSNRPRRAAGKAPSGRGAGRTGGGKHAAGPAPELDLERARTGIARRESAPDGEWMVRLISADRAGKTYVCPGCSTAVTPGTAHLVVWAEDHLFGAAAGLAERRHWHSNCWTSRSYRYR